MSKQVPRKFSRIVKESQSLEKGLQQVGHPRLKQIIAQVLTEENGDETCGSAFGEAVQPAG